MEGKVKFFLENKGYGFITGADEREYFFHVSNMLETVNKGDSVEYDLEASKKGMKAINIVKKVVK